LGGGEGEGEDRVVKASTKGAKPKAVGLGDLPQKILKSLMLRGVFPPSQMLKDIPTKCTFWVNFVGKTLRSDKKAI
jgi:hypothetical protein